ncbi:MAG: radical SAM family heme chaperone HemW [Saprospiraceae bacterium]|nr:radical SAM family heme chaperone HemW [Saprospiraceae bacterium]
MQNDLNISNKKFAGIYIHIPYCKRKCSYCNFHFSTNLTTMDALMQALLKEISARAPEALEYGIQSMYLGGGTPSLLSPNIFEKLFETILKYYHLSEDCEITLEANPDDIHTDLLRDWKTCGINRLSIGIQSFHQEDLNWMNRTHTVKQALESLNQVNAANYSNFTLDLMYGLPGSNSEKLKFNLEQIQKSGTPHFSAYALTLEERTALVHLYKKDILQPVEDINTIEQMYQILDFCEASGFEAYEISNFAKPGYRSRHNSSYWQGLPYFGFGPSAHSFDGLCRRWNISNNNAYIQNIQQENSYFESEVLSDTDKYNEYILLNLRKKEGVDFHQIEMKFPQFAERFLKEIKRHLGNGEIHVSANSYILTRKGKSQADRISSELFQLQ